MRRSSRSTSILLIVACAVGSTALAGPAQRDPADAEGPGWSAPARPGSNWNDPAPLWSDPRGDQAQQGRTWANPRRGQLAAPPGAADGIGRDVAAPLRQPPEPPAPEIKQGEAAPPPRDRVLERPAERGGAAAERKAAQGAARGVGKLGDAPRRRAEAPIPPPRRSARRLVRGAETGAPDDRSPVVLRPPPPRRLAGRRDGYRYAPPQAPEGSASAAEPRYAARFAVGPRPPYPFAPPPACPLVIKVGNGLANPVRSQVLSGRPYCL